MNPMRMVKKIVKNKVVQLSFLAVILVGVFTIGMYRIIGGYEDIEQIEIETEEIEVTGENVEK